MGKSDEDAIAEFNKHVNMSADEIEKWLDDPQSKDAGTGVGLESARKIIKILHKNPSKDPTKYDQVSSFGSHGPFDTGHSSIVHCHQEDIAHIHKVAGYHDTALIHGGMTLTSTQVYCPALGSGRSLEKYQDARGIEEHEEHDQVCKISDFKLLLTQVFLVV